MNNQEKETKSKTFQRAVADLPVELHMGIKAICVARNISIKKYIMQAIMEKFAREKIYE
jgi:hypothetical protein